MTVFYGCSFIVSKYPLMAQPKKYTVKLVVQSCSEIGKLKIKQGSMKAMRHNPEKHKKLFVPKNQLRMKQKQKDDTTSTVNAPVS